jgi:hypothetical protein
LHGYLFLFIRNAFLLVDRSLNVLDDRVNLLVIGRIGKHGAVKNGVLNHRNDCEDEVPGEKANEPSGVRHIRNVLVGRSQKRNSVENVGDAHSNSSRRHHLINVEGYVCEDGEGDRGKHEKRKVKAGVSLQVEIYLQRAHFVEERRGGEQMLIFFHPKVEAPRKVLVFRSLELVF